MTLAKKLANVGYKLQYVTPTKNGEVVEIEKEDIRSEITYWAALFCVFSINCDTMIHKKVMGEVW